VAFIASLTESATGTDSDIAVRGFSNRNGWINFTSVCLECNR
jgi:hypothetical protein